MSAIRRLLEGFDRYQQGHRWVGFPLGVVKKFGEDQAGNLAALIAYYGFLSLFPLLLVMVSVLGLVLRGDPELQKQVVDSALGQFPVIGQQLQRGLGTLLGPGAGVAVGVGTLVALWAGMGVMQAAQSAMNDVWDVPRRERPNFLQARLRALAMLFVLGSFILASTFLAGLGTARGTIGVLLRVVGIAGSLGLNLAAFMVSYRLLTDRALTWREVLPGAAFAGVVWSTLQAVGGLYVSHQLRGASQVYGMFAIVLGLLGWIYLGAQVTLLGAEVNAVRAKRLWPRSLTQPPLQPADRTALTQAAKQEERVPEQRVDVSFATGQELPGPGTGRRSA